MKFGLHYLLSVSESQLASQRYRDTLEQAVRAEGLGFESVWPVEQHFNQMQSALPCPTLLLAAIAARTTTLRLGTAIVQLPLAHPLRTAEEIATLDVLSGGRVEFGVGRGSQPKHFTGFGVPLAESRDRMVEALDYLRVAFTHDRFSFDGRFFHADDICLVTPTGAAAPSTHPNRRQQPGLLRARGSTRIPDSRRDPHQPATEATRASGDLPQRAGRGRAPGRDARRPDDSHTVLRRRLRRTSPTGRGAGR